MGAVFTIIFCIPSEWIICSIALFLESIYIKKKK